MLLAEVSNVSAILPVSPTPVKIVVPLCVSLVAAGFPSPADDYLEERIDLNKELIRHPLSTFFVRVSGDSMTGAGINADDLLVVDKAAPVTDGHIIVAVVNGEFCVKEFCRAGQQIILLSANERYAPIEITPETEFEVWGRVTFIIREA